MALSTDSGAPQSGAFIWVMGDRKWKAICASEKKCWHPTDVARPELLRKTRPEVIRPDLPGPPPEVGELTEEQRQNKRLAVEARARRRLAIKYSRVRDRISTGGATQPAAVTRKHLDLLKQYDS